MVVLSVIPAVLVVVMLKERKKIILIHILDFCTAESLVTRKPIIAASHVADTRDSIAYDAAGPLF